MASQAPREMGALQETFADANCGLRYEPPLMRGGQRIHRPGGNMFQPRPRSEQAESLDRPMPACHSFSDARPVLLQPARRQISVNLKSNSVMDATLPALSALIVRPKSLFVNETTDQCKATDSKALPDSTPIGFWPCANSPRARPRNPPPLPFQPPDPAFAAPPIPRKQSRPHGSPP